MHRLTLLVPIVLPVLAPADEVGDALDALIERTNALDGFVAEYACESSSGATGTLVLEYAAPDRMHLSWGGEWLGGALIHYWVDGEEFCAVMDEPDGTSSYALVEMPGSPSTARVLLTERFPRPEEDAPESRPSVGFTLGIDQETHRTSFHVQLESTAQREALLRWLPTWREQADLVEWTEEGLVLTHERYGGTIRLDTGFPSEVWLIGITGEERSLRLESLSEEAPADEGCFEFPRSCPADREDRSETLRQRCEVDLARWNRLACFAAMNDALASERVDWSESVREDARDVFRALHAPRFEALEEQPSDSLRSWIESYAEWLGAQFEAGRTAEDLRERAARKWTELEESDGSKNRANWLEALTAQEVPPGASGHHDDLLELEAEVFIALCDEHVAAPFRQAFQEAVEQALDR